MKPIKLILALVILSVLSVLFFGFGAQAQVTPTTIGSFTNLPAIVNTATSSNQTSAIIVQPGKGIAVDVAITMSAAGASNALYHWMGSADGTNIATTAFRTNYLPMNGTTLQRGTFVFQPDELAGLKLISLGKIENPHTTGVLTNRGVIYSRQN